MQPPCKGGKKGYKFCLGHMTKMAVIPIYGKNLLQQNHWVDCLGTWHVSSEEFFIIHINDDPGFCPILCHFTLEITHTGTAAIVASILISTHLFSE